MNTSENDAAFLEELRKLTKKTEPNEDSYNKLKGKLKDSIVKKEIEIKKSTENQKNTALIKEPEKELTQQKPSYFETKPIFGKDKFSWEEKPIKIKNQEFEEYKEIAPIEINKAMEKQRNTMEFEWEKKQTIEEPKPEDFTNEKSNFDWLKKEIVKGEFGSEKKEKISSPIEKNLINETKNEENEINSFENKLNIEKFDWENETSIEEPNFDDFKKEQLIGAKWKHNKLDETKIEINNESESKIIPEAKKSKGAKWKHSQTEQIINDDSKKVEIVEAKNEMKIESLEEKDKENYEIVSNEGSLKNIEETKNKKGKKKKEIEKIWTGEKIADDKTTTENLRTIIDDLFKILEEYKVVDTAQFEQSFNVSYEEIEKIAKIFEDYGIVEIRYPTSLTAKAKIILKKEVQSTIKSNPEGEIIDEYQIEVDHVPANISIIMGKEDSRPIYSIQMPAIGKYTKKFLSLIKNEIAEDLPIELDEILDPKKSKKLKERFFQESQKHLRNYFSKTTPQNLDLLSGVVLHEMYGLGAIEVVLGDDMLEEVAINSAKTPITIYHRIHGWLKTNLYPGTEEEIMNYASQIGRKIGREITMLNPILDAHLLSGDRVNATLSPISAEGNTLTIRRFARRPWTLIDFIGKSHTMSSEMAALLWLAMQYEMNIIISGGTASGKTSTLNTLLALVPSYHRIISIEDVREIILPIYLNWNWIPMITRSANPEGLGEVTMLDCMVTSLRMRPDRIIVGEIRRKREAEVLMEAIETGHSIYSTIHANSAYQVLRRMAEPPMSVPLMQIELLDLIVTQFRDRKTNKRRTYEIAEVEQTTSGKGLQINTIYKWSPRTDNWEQLNKPTKLFTTLNMHTGMTEDEINKELKERTKILDWMKEKNISDLNMIGFVVKLFYNNPDKIKKMATDKTSKEEIQRMMQ